MAAYEAQIRLQVAYGTPRYEVEKALAEALGEVQKKLGGYGRSTFSEPTPTGPTPDETVDALFGLFYAASQSYRDRKNAKETT